MTSARAGLFTTEGDRVSSGQLIYDSAAFAAIVSSVLTIAAGEETLSLGAIVSSANL